MRAGELRNKIIVQAQAQTQDATGYPAKGWTDSHTAYASIQPLTGREALVANQVYADASHLVTMRYQSGVTTNHRIKFGSRYFDIKQIQNIEERGRELRLTCTEKL